jgi:hypothetical protein
MEMEGLSAFSSINRLKMLNSRSQSIIYEVRCVRCLARRKKLNNRKTIKISQNGQGVFHIDRSPTVVSTSSREKHDIVSGEYDK